jgi:hypothetical protein
MLPPPPPALVDDVEVVDGENAEEFVVPARGAVVVVLELAIEGPMEGSETAPPDAGNPLLCAALPTAPLVGVAEGATVWAAAAAVSAVESSKACPAERIMTR